MKSDAPPGPRAEGAFDAPQARTLRCPSCGGAAREGDGACAHCGSLLLTRRCAACFALSPRDAERCVRCGALLPTEALKPAPGTCPDCRSALVARQAGAVGFSECPRCGGLFLTREAFDAVTKDAGARASVKSVEPEAASRDANLAAKFHYRKCPACSALMGRSNYAGGSGIMVDVCRTHGVWFDRGELTAIVDFIEGGGSEHLRIRDLLRKQEEAALERRRRAAAGAGGVPNLAGVPDENSGVLSKVVYVLDDVIHWFPR